MKEIQTRKTNQLVHFTSDQEQTSYVLPEVTYLGDAAVMTPSMVLVLCREEKLLVQIDLEKKSTKKVHLDPNFYYRSLEVFPDSSLFCIIKKQKYVKDKYDIIEYFHC